MRKRLPSLNALRAFETVAKHHSIKKAAVEMRVSPSAISRYIAILEAQIGSKLFVRAPGGLGITPDGIKLAASVGSALDQIGQTVDMLYSDPNTLTLRVLPTFAIRWLYPRLKRFEDLHPNINLIIHTRWMGINYDQDDYDLGIRYGVGTWPRELLTELYPEWLAPVCAPDYLSALEGRKIKSDFSNVILLHPMPDHFDWACWAKGWGGKEFPTNQGRDFDMLDLALRAAENGFGIAMADILLAMDDLVPGRLTIPVEKVVPSANSYFLACRKEVKDRRAFKKFKEWLLSELDQSRMALNPYKQFLV